MDKKKFYQEPSIRVVKVRVALMNGGTNNPQTGNEGGQNGGGASRGYRSFDDED